jgi:hypothetical protein
MLGVEVGQVNEGYGVDGVAHDDTIEREARFGTIPGDELVYGMLLYAARG